MYQPPHHREDSLEVQHALIRAHPLGALVTFGVGGLSANLIPFILDTERAPNGSLREDSLGYEQFADARHPSILCLSRSTPPVATLKANRGDLCLA